MPMPEGYLLSLDNPVFSQYAFYGTAVTFKLFAMGFLTGRQRSRKGVFGNPEDTMFNKATRQKGPVYDDVDVERVRRNHLNDLENIPAFLAVGLLYVCTKPDPTVALWHFRVFAASRLLHTFCYQMGLQPWRSICHLLGLASTVSMGVQVLRAEAY